MMQTLPSRPANYVAALFGPPELASSVRFRSPDALLLLTCVAILYIIGYLTHPAAPTLHVSFSGWLGWFDQGEYHKTARDLAALNLRPSIYWYGYPLLAAPFVPFIPQHPFLIPNLCLVCGTVLFFHAACRTLVSRLEAWVLALAAFFIDPALRADSLIYPWNSIPVYFAIFATVWLTLFRGERAFHWYLAAAAIGLATSCRPPDLPILLVIYYSGLLLRPKREGGELPKRTYLMMAAAPLAAAGFVLTLQFAATYAVYGSFVSKYLAATNSVGFSLGRFPIKVYQWLVDPMLLSGAETFLPAPTIPRGVISRLPHALLILPGIALIVRSQGWRAVGLPLALGPTLAVYLGFNAANYPAHYWSYTGYHHIWWFTPWLALWAWLAITRAWWVLPFRRFTALVLLPVGLVSLFAFRASVRSQAEIVLEPSATARATPTTALARITTEGLRFEALVPRETPLDAIRITGNPALPFHASNAGTHLAFTVAFGDRKLRAFADYFPVGAPNELVVSFLPSPLRAPLEEPLEIEIRRPGVEASRPQKLEFLEVKWQPGANLGVWYSTLFPKAVPFPTPPEARGLKSAELLSGWSAGGAGFVWTLGKRATLRLSAEPGRMLTSLEFTGEAFVKQELTIRLDGKLIGKKTVLAREDHRISLADSPPARGSHEISFEVSDPTSPRAVGMNTDERLLGVALWRIDFAYLPLNEAK